MAPVKWGKAARLAIPWAIAGTICNVLLWVFGRTTSPSGLFLSLLGPACLMALFGGLVHRSQRVGLLAGLIVISLTIFGFLLLLVLALNIHVNP